jgi:hypothetical protein
MRDTYLKLGIRQSAGQGRRRIGSDVPEPAQWVWLDGRSKVKAVSSKAFGKQSVDFKIASVVDTRAQMADSLT